LSIIDSNTSFSTATKKSDQTLLLIDCCVHFHESVTACKQFEGCIHPKYHKIPANPMAEAIRFICEAQNKRKQQNGSISHPPIGTIKSSMHPQRNQKQQKRSPTHLLPAATTTR
jgi:hypothetical protein